MDYTSKRTNKTLNLGTFIKDLQGYLQFDLLTSLKRLEARKIKTAEPGQPGLLFLGYFKNHQPGQLYVIDNSPRSYYHQLNRELKKKLLMSVQHLKIPVFIFCGKKPERPEIRLFEKYNFPVLFTPISRKDVSSKIERYLNFFFAEKKSVHGVLMDIFGVGLLIRGESGIGKSEVALDLLDKRHRLISDDLVILHKQEDFIIGYGRTSHFSFHVEARGVGLIDIRNLFGIKSIRMKKRVEVIVELVKGDMIDFKTFDRLRLEPSFENIFNVEIPKYTIPVTYSKNLANIVEVIALSHIANIMGENPVATINRKIAESSGKREKGDAFIDKLDFIIDNE